MNNLKNRIVAMSWVVLTLSGLAIAENELPLVR